MEETIENSSAKQVSLMQMAKRNSVFSLLLFVALIAIIFVAFQRDRDSMSTLEDVYRDQFNIEHFKATLFDVISPLNDFALTSDEKNFQKLKDAIKHYETTYAVIKTIPHLTAENHKSLAKVHQLMTEVMNIASDVANQKIAANQTGTVTILAQNLVLGAQAKLESIVQGLEEQLNRSSAERQEKATMQLYILLAFIVFIVLLLEFLSRKLVNHAQQLSRASSSVATGIGDILDANKAQASASEQQTRFMEKVIKGLELIADSGTNIATTATSAEKAASVSASLAKGGLMEMEGILASVTTLKEGAQDESGTAGLVNSKSDQLIRVLEQISEVSDEAQLMAVNASIESSGSSSSVVDEMERMANQIRLSSDEIRAIVQELRDGVIASGTDNRVQSINNIEELSHRVTDLMSKIHNMSEKGGLSSGLVIQATARQNERNQKIMQALKHISELLQISGNKLHASNEASVRLSEASESLQNMS
ncbi:methyl-accepting chemotaxis protein [Mariprofundus sp. NF]|uniref:methyl-accepting chemotaxis protein n=1 Tax=Mariprofundus sp. NF TaxID=2608716 RepID=UPI0015A2049F|nr:methyl-accepting chemotaxis protein [Mariprofundus sp. NF]NWF39465.1 methyl-accepting chemotaxis protein [Mariprofundus sp. NF]